MPRTSKDCLAEFRGNEPYLVRDILPVRSKWREANADLMAKELKVALRHPNRSRIYRRALDIMLRLKVGKTVKAKAGARSQEFKRDTDCAPA